MNRKFWILALLFSLACMSQARERIIFDTDSGFFGDDGCALVMAARSPKRVEILGITVVSGNVWAPQGAVYMLHNLQLLDRPQIPLFVGAQAPLIHTVDMTKWEVREWGPIEYKGAFAQVVPVFRHDLKPPQGGQFPRLSPQKTNAVDFLIDTIERNPGDITVVELGPMTNLAMALRLKPDIAKKIKQLVFMGGNIRVAGNSTPAAEFNFWFDPEAAQVVLRSKIPRKIMFGLDICNQARLTRERFDQIIATKTPITELYREDFGNHYPGFLKNPKVKGYLWDELVAAWLIEPAFVTASQTMYLDVDTHFGKTYGKAVVLDRKLAPEATPVRVMLRLDFPRVFRLYKMLLTK